MSDEQQLSATSPPESAPAISVVLPAHNEVALLGSTITNLVSGLEARQLSYEIIVVENGSTDGTLQLARVLAAQLPACTVVTLPRGDYGAALAAGFETARGETVFNFDVDYYDLHFLDVALQRLGAEGCALVLASKRAAGASDRRPVLRRLLTSGFAALLRSLVDFEVTDAHGMKALSRRAVAPIVEQCVLRGPMFDVEMVLRSSRMGLGIVEVPATVVERRPPRTSVVSRSLESALGVLRLRRLVGPAGGTAGRRRGVERVRRLGEKVLRLAEKVRRLGEKARRLGEKARRLGEKVRS